jgi:hypothetical protein
MADNPFDPDEEDVVNAPRRMGGADLDISKNLYFDPGSFERRWLVQGSPHAQFAAQREQEERLRDLGKPPPLLSGKEEPWDPAGPDSLYNPRQADVPGRPEDIEDQRGMSMGQVDLLAKYQRSKGEFGGDPNYEPTGPQSYRYRDMPKIPLTKAYPHFVGNLKEDDLNSPADDRRWVMEDQYLHPLRHQYNTPLDDLNEANRYLKWAGKMGKDPEEEEKDYDLRGAFKAGIKPAKDGHLPDTFKKPSHITFSDESRYSGPGNEGGHWVQDAKGNYVAFRVGAANLVHHTPEQIRDYFKNFEPGTLPIFPPGTEPEPEMSTFKDRFPEATPMEKYNERQRAKREKK